MKADKKKVLIINGSASEHSSTQKLIDQLGEWTSGLFTLTFCDALSNLPHFNPELSIAGTPGSIVQFRQQIQEADGVIICTPEYIFSIPAGLKNALEWCVAAPIFSGKVLGIITASANGAKGHEELQLIMQTLMADFNAATTLLIPGIKGKINEQGQITDAVTNTRLEQFLAAFKLLLSNTPVAEEPYS
ncbi:MAG: FMN reductase [Bacteroidetes bacterium 43-16]|nr:MAG: FMN reductase [Bacteroidetes bacterium 43-16]